MMTSRKRIAEAINFRKTDRVPVDLGGMVASGINATAYSHLKKYLGLAGETKVGDPLPMVAVVEEEVRQRLHVDVVPLCLNNALWWAKKEEWIPKKLFDGQKVLFSPGTRIREEDDAWVLLGPDGSPTSYRMPRNGFYFDDTSFDRETGKFKPDDFAPVTTIPDEQLKIMSDYGKHLYKNTDYAILGWDFGVCFLGLSLVTNKRNDITLGRPSEWMTMLLTEKNTCHEMMDRAAEAFISRLKLINEAVGDYCFAWGTATDDSGTQRGEFINPDLWSEMIKPHYKKICDWTHQHTKMKTFLHSCGSIYRLLPHFIEVGIDILNPVQTSAANMDPARLKKEFGDKIVFWGGGCDTQHILPNATAEEVRQHVKDRLAIFTPNGGYVFNQIHTIQQGVPPENIVAMFDAVSE